MKYMLLVSAASLSLVAATTAHAAQQTQGGETTEVVVVGQKVLPAKSTAANKTGISNLLTPQAIQVVPKVVIDDQNAMTLQEATRNVSGVGTDFGFNGEMEPLLILRGFPSTSMSAMGAMSGSSNYYVDGTKVTGLPVNMSNVRSVEVVKGPNSVLFGRGEPGGLVNVVSRDLRVKPGFDFEQTLGSYGLARTSLNASGAVNSDKTLLLGVSANQYDTNSYRDFVEDHLTAFGLRAQWTPGANDLLSASLDYTRHSYRTDYGVPAVGDHIADVPDNVQYNDSPDLSGEKILAGHLEYTHHFSENWSLKLRGTKVDADTREVDIAPYRVDLSGTGACDFDNAATTCRYYFNDRPVGKYKMHQVTADLTGKVFLGGLTHNLLFGAETYSADKSGATYFEQVSSVNIYNPVLGSTPSLDTVNSPPSEILDKNSWDGIYAQDQVDFGNGLNLVLVVRHDITKAIYAAPGTEPNKVEFTSPRVGLVWQVKPNQVIYGQYQKALATNNGRDTDGVTPLKPETAKQTEIGYKYVTNDNRLSANIALYELTKYNRADFSLYPIKLLTTGEARSRGLEVDVIGQVTKSLSLIGSYAYTDTKVVADTFYAGKKLANVPENAASLWANYEFSPKWHGGVGAFYQGDRFGDLGNTFILPAYTRVDAMLGYSFKAAGTDAMLQLNVKNLFDVRYYTGSHQFVSDWIRPGAPRTFTVTLRLAY